MDALFLLLTKVRTCYIINIESEDNMKNRVVSILSGGGGERLNRHI